MLPLILFSLSAPPQVPTPPQAPPTRTEQQIKDHDDRLRRLEATIYGGSARPTLAAPVTPATPVPTPRTSGYNPYGLDYRAVIDALSIPDSFYSECGTTVVLAIGVANPAAGRDQANCSVPSGYGGLADGVYDCWSAGGLPVLRPRLRGAGNAPATPASAAVYTNGTGGFTNPPGAIAAFIGPNASTCRTTTEWVNGRRVQVTTCK